MARVDVISRWNLARRFAIDLARPMLTLSGMKTVTSKILPLVVLLAALAPAHAQDDLTDAPQQLSIPATTDAPSEQCRRLDGAGPEQLVQVPLPRTFHDDFAQHPLKSGKWVPHYAGGAYWPKANYWGGKGSDIRRKDAYNGEQQIYVDPHYGGRWWIPLGLDPFRVRNGV